jgi:hypothetical protein
MSAFSNLKEVNIDLPKNFISYISKSIKDVSIVQKLDGYHESKAFDQFYSVLFQHLDEIVQPSSDEGSFESCR